MSKKLSQDTSAVDTAEQVEVQVGRRAPYSQVGDWVLLAPIRPAAKALYWALSAHINTTRDDTEVWPTQDMLAEIMRLSRGDKIKTYLDELIALDAIDVSKTARYAGGMRERCIYTVHQSPPKGYAGLLDLSTFYADRKARIEAAQAENSAKPQVTRAPRNGGTAAPRNGGSNKTNPNKTNGTQTNLNETKAGGETPPPDPASQNPDTPPESVVTTELKIETQLQTARVAVDEAQAQAPNSGLHQWGVLALHMELDREKALSTTATGQHARLCARQIIDLQAELRRRNTPDTGLGALLRDAHGDPTQLTTHDNDLLPRRRTRR